MLSICELFWCFFSLYFCQASTSKIDLLVKIKFIRQPCRLPREPNEIFILD